jgi:hypothetical protein
MTRWRAVLIGFVLLCVASAAGVASAHILDPPAISCGSADGVWHGADVTIACTASDSDFGLQNPSDANFSLSTSVPAGTETANASTNSHQVCDNNGDCATAGPITGNMIDKKGPSISITSPVGSGTVSNPAVISKQPIAFSTIDGGSGVATWTAKRYRSRYTGGTGCAPNPTTWYIDDTDTGSGNGNHVAGKGMKIAKCYYWTLASTDAVGNPAVPVTSEVVRLSLFTATPAMLGFGIVQTGTQKTLTDTIGQVEGNLVGSASIAGSSFSISGGTCSIGSKQQLQRATSQRPLRATSPQFQSTSCTIQVTFSPTHRGSQSTGTLTVTGVDGVDTIAIPLKGTGN